MGVYTDLGVKRVINAWGPMTRIGSALVRPEVVAAMAEAAGWYVDVIDLQRAAGQRLAGMIGVEACYIAGGCAAGLAIATAACVTGGDPARIARLPDTSGMPNEVIMQRSHRNPYDHAIRQVGVRLVEIGNAWRTFDWELEAAVGPATAAVVHLYGHRTMYEPLSLSQTVALAHGRGVPVIVDAAAEVPPARNLRVLKETGADAVVISGGKGLRGPQNSALVLTSQAMVEACIPNACPNHSLGRSMKTTKEDMVGLVRAVELYLALDHEAVARGWEADVDLVVRQLEGIAGVRAARAEAGYSEGIPVARIEVDEAGRGGGAAAVAEALAAGDPSIRVTQTRNWLSINPQFMEAGEAPLVAARLRQVLGA
ncbi:MAG: hypothetical protein ABIL09_03375 [Gemmatimonadota bacterium]